MKRTKQWLSLLLSLIMVLSVLAVMPLSSAFADIYITDVANASGSSFTNISKLASALNGVFSGDIDIYSNSGCTNEISMTLGTSMSTSTQYYVKSKTTGNNVSGWQCYIYANAVYNKLFNEWVGHGSSFSHSERVISGGSNTASYSMFSSAGVRCGAYMRTTNNSSGAYNGSSGHSLIVLKYNSSTISYLEGNADGKGLIRITTQTWTEFNKGELSGRSRYISHIIQPTDLYYDSLYPGDSSNTLDYINPDNYIYPTSTIYYTSPTMKGSTVSWVQAVLYQLGYSIDVDGSYGKNSEAVVKQFQSAYGLEVDGRVGPATRAKLLELWNKKKHTHCFTVLTESAHPHKVYRSCSCGYTEYTGEYKTVYTCDSCLPEKSVLTVLAGTSLDYTSFTWKVAQGADCYELIVYKNGDNNPVKWLYNLTSNQYRLKLSAGDYTAYVASINNDLIDSSCWWVYSDKVTFSVADGGELTPIASTEYDGSRYELYNVSIPWYEAKTKCEELGGHLVVITSAEENEVVGELVSQGGRHSYWMGLSDDASEGDWLSITNEALIYENWMDGEPNNQNNEDYAVIRNVEGKTWNDVGDTYHTVLVGFICEYDNDYTSALLCGDANIDGSVNIKDATAIQKNVAGLEHFTETQIQIADVNNDDAVNIKDATAIQKHIARVDMSLDIGKALVI